MANPKCNMRCIVAALILYTPFYAQQAAANDIDFDTQLAVQVVNDYRQLRMSCNDQKDQARRMCYYRLRIGIWDYKEARKILGDKGLRIVDGTQVAVID